MTWDLCTIDWVAIGSVATGAMAIATFITLNNNKKQFKELQRQSFENTLFQLLHEVKKLLSEVSNIPPEGMRISGLTYGLQALESEYQTFKSFSTCKVDENKNGDPIEIPIEPNYDNVKEAYIDIYHNMSNLGSYFRSLYRVIKYIDESNFTDEEKYQYTSFVRAQLTDIELLWLFYNCKVGYGEEKFKPLVEKYSLLKNMPQTRLIHKNHLAWIKESAFKKDKSEIATEKKRCKIAKFFMERKWFLKNKTIDKEITVQ